MIKEILLRQTEEFIIKKFVAVEYPLVNADSLLYILYKYDIKNNKVSVFDNKFNLIIPECVVEILYTEEYENLNRISAYRGYISYIDKDCIRINCTEMKFEYNKIQSIEVVEPERELPWFLNM